MRFLTPVFLICLFSMPAMAIVDVHDEFYAKPDLAAFSVFDFSLSGATGNKEETDFSLETHSIIRKNASTWLLVGAASFAETNNQESKSSVFLHGRYSRQFSVTSKHGVDFLAQYGRDKFERLQRRLVVGAGYRYEWKQGIEHERGLLGVGLIREHEQYFGGNTETKSWRANLYATAAIPIDLPQGASFSISTYLQPDIEDLSDLRSVAVLGFKAQLSKRLALKITLDQEYYADPEPGLEKSNITYSTGLSYSLY